MVEIEPASVRFAGRGVLAACLLLITSPLLVAQGPDSRIDEMEFSNQPITDVLLALAQVGNVSIIADETVRGTASYYFADTTFREALERFLSAYNLHYRIEHGVYYVSRVDVRYDSQTDEVSVRVDSMDVTTVVRTVSRRIGKTILYDSLPREFVTLTVDGVPPQRLLSIVMRRFPDYTIEVDEDYFYIRRVPQAELRAQAEGIPEVVVREGDRYSLSIETARFREVVDQLFRIAAREYSLFVQGDAVLQDLRFSNRTFEETLRLVLDHGSADYTIEDGIYQIFDVQRRDILRRFVQTLSLPLQHLGVQHLPTLLPPELAAANLFRLDQETNTVILSGSAEQITPIRRFIEAIDVPQENRRYHRFDLRYLPVAEAIGALPQRFSVFRPTAIPNSNAFVIALSDEMRSELDSFVELIDVSRRGHPVTLRYLKAADLLANLPPSVNQDQIVGTGMPEVVFFRGSEAGLETFLRDLEVIDRPRPQIRYELLIIQYEESDRLTVDPAVENSVFDGESHNSFLGEIGSLLALDFDIISTFGYQFAVDLSAQLSNTQARVLADTTLNGLSGEALSFQNTSTFRYVEPGRDPDDEDRRTRGVVSEITSGLILTVNGWTSGDGMITMEVSATVSKQASADIQDDAGGIPTTSERVVTTHVRTESGEPVIISGLVQQEANVSESKVPILGSIPLLGRLFRTTNESVDTTELAIYIVPHVERTPDEGVHLGRAFEMMYRRHRGDR